MKEEYKIIIAGSRGFNNYDFMKDKVDKLISAIRNEKDIIIISGTANGADKMGEKYAIREGFNLIQKPADWDKYGKRAGYLRNQEMADIADACVIFWDGVSPGSKHMYDICKKSNVAVRLIKY